MKRKSSIIMLLCALTGFVLAGCGNSSDTSTPPSTTPPSTNAAPATPPSTN